MLRKWQEFLKGVSVDTPDEIETKVHVHDHVEDFEIVDPPEDGEDMEVNHGGNDICQDVEDAPSRKEAEGSESEESEGLSEGSKESEETESGGSESEAGGSSDESESDDSDSDGSSSNESGSDGSSDESGESDDSDDSGESETESDEAATPQTTQKQSQKRAFQLDSSLEIVRRRRLANTLATIIGKIAEDLAGWPVDGDDEWNIHAIMERRVNRRPLNQCRQSREKERIVIILDTSGSCAKQARFYASIVREALKQGTVELYDAPNGWIEAKNVGNGWEAVEDGKWQFNGRIIIFFGDFDGGDDPVIASRNNKVFWFSSEDRYDDMDEHSWCSYTLKDFRGKYYPCFDESDFIRLAKKIRA